MIENINSEKILDLDKIYDTIFLKTDFSLKDISDISPINKTSSKLKSTYELLKVSSNSLKNGGLIFIYGAPKYLSFYADYLNNLEEENSKYLFKYWIGIKFEDMFVEQPIPNSHIGVLMFLKTKKTKNPTPFKLNTKEYRIPYSNCLACSDNLKDWGGKKHLMNPLGTAISDVWTDLELDSKDLNNPVQIIDRVYNLTKTNGENLLVINEKTNTVEIDNYEVEQTQAKSNKFDVQNFEYLNKVVKMDCIEFMGKIKEEYPEGIYDLAFADPPYNLEKNYAKYEDDKEDIEYIEWCNKWLDGMYDILKPGGSLLVLNIPKWAIEHYINLAPKMNFRNWIIWDALSTPSGKILPAHYALLHFTKPSNSKENKTKTAKIEIDSREYCLRNRCIKERKSKGEDNKELLNDIWRDVHRIKHKKDRDSHPCQLPTKLMDRIIEIYSDEGDLVFDPFGGAGTSAISARLMKRNYTITDIDKEYFDIATNNLNRIRKNLLGELVYERSSVKNTKQSKVSQKQIEKEYLNICFKHNSAIDIERIKTLDRALYNDIIDYYPRGFKNLQKIANRQLENIDILNQREL